jgi:hypothetical protein
MGWIEPKKWMIEDLENKEAMIITCPKCGNDTFIGIAQGFTSGNKPYPVGECAQCLTGLRRLNSEKDLDLLMEFRGEYWDKWVRFCLERDYRPCVE